MTIGNRIQQLRKKLGLSQEELGQRLIVSRQTVSQWETDQTVPTIDNLILLREIFGISVDELLFGQNRDGRSASESEPESEPESSPEPDEFYRFSFDEAELEAVRRSRTLPLIRPLWVSIPSCLYLLFMSLYFAVHNQTGPAVFMGMLWIILFLFRFVRGLRLLISVGRKWKPIRERVVRSVYEYRLFGDQLEISIFRDREKRQVSRFGLSDIQGTQDFGDLLAIKLSDTLYLLKKEGLSENSALLRGAASASAE